MTVYLPKLVFSLIIHHFPAAFTPSLSNLTYFNGVPSPLFTDDSQVNFQLTT